MLKLVESHFMPAPEKEVLPPPPRRKVHASTIERRKEIASGYNQGAPLLTLCILCHG